ncbi:hypothetical protein M8494_13385 [Serratia ureilytica]
MTGSIAGGKNYKTPPRRKRCCVNFIKKQLRHPLGDGANGGAAQTVAATAAQEIKVYARLFFDSTLPTSGV